MIQVSSASVTYPYSELPTLQDIELELDEGHIGVVLGGNDSGKTTLLNLINGIVPKIQKATVTGTVKTCGAAGVAIQDSDIFLMPTVAEEIEFPLYSHWGNKAFITEKMSWLKEIFNLSGLMNRQVHTLSGGERQRVQLATALAADNKIILLDEPLAQLDVKTAESIKEILRSEARSGKTILIASSSSYQYDDLADKYYILDKGRICWQGKPVLFEEQKKSAKLKGIDTDGKGLLQKSPVNKSPNSQSTIISDLIAVDIKNVDYAYNDNFGIKNINFSLNKGETTAITGENGSGKTTVLKMLAGILKPSRGDILLFGESILGKTISDATRDSGFLFQNPDHQLFHSQIEDELIWGLKKRGFTSEESEIRIEKWLEILNLSNLSKEHPYSLSKSYRQWIALASILVREPALLLLDEPTFGMDTLASKRFADILKSLTVEGKTVILITHQHALADYCADSVIKMHRGIMQP